MCNANKLRGKSPGEASDEVPMNDIQAPTPPSGGATTTVHQQPNRATRRVEMTTTPETHIGEPDTEVTLEAVSRTPILITEQEVVFGTAVAAPPRPTTMRWWTGATAVVVAALHRMFATSAPDARPPRRHYPKRYVFLEHSRLAREMDRL
jgi:hypothetical protein